MSAVPTSELRPQRYEYRVWRVRLWIRALSVLQALGWVTLFLSLGVRGDETILTWAALAVFVVVAPFLALWPRILLRPDGSLVLRDWIAVRTVTVEDITRLSMSKYGLHFEFADRTSFTSVIFQATRHIRYPRVFDFVEAITGERPLLEDWNVWDAAFDQGIQLLPSPRARTDPSTWFAGTAPRTSDEQQFVARIRELAPSWDPQLRPPDTQAIGLVPLVLGITVPDLSIRLTLWVAYRSAEQSLIGCWGDDYVLDDYDPADPEQLTVQDGENSPSGLAERASEWIAHQLARPVSREWWGRSQSRLVFDDSGDTAWGYVSRRRLDNGEPTRRVVERPSRS